MTKLLLTFVDDPASSVLFVRVSTDGQGKNTRAKDLSPGTARNVCRHDIDIKM